MKCWMNDGRADVMAQVARCEVRLCAHNSSATDPQPQAWDSYSSVVLRHCVFGIEALISRGKALLHKRCVVTTVKNLYVHPSSVLTYKQPALRNNTAFPFS